MMTDEQESFWPALPASPVYCYGPLLGMVQKYELFKDCKTFVDMPMTSDPDVVLSHFDDLVSRGAPDKDTLLEFVNQHFSAAGHELETWTPSDWTPRTKYLSSSPNILHRIRNLELRSWAKELNELWKVLGRKISDHDHPERRSLITIPNPFIVPGDRFKEFYYWDSYWIIGGLLAVGMTDTVRGMLNNFLHIVDRYGFVPNGGRIYYLCRSQPPLLSPMVSLYYQHTSDISYIRDNIALLEKEHQFWIKKRSVTVSGHSLARYDVTMTGPRPEGYREDFELTQHMDAPDAKRTFSHLAGACESGWDFSTRWFGDPKSLKSIKTGSIVPVDLNVYLCWTEQILSRFHGLLGNLLKQEEYKTFAHKRKTAIDDIFWNNDLGAWFDFDLETNEQRTNFYPSNVFPLLVKCTNLNLEDENISSKLLDYLNINKVGEFPGGVPTSLLHSGQQWDFPNAWSPLVHLMVESVSTLPTEGAKHWAKNLATKWMWSNHDAWKKHGHMYEKYDVQHSGAPGGGGEYSVQLGFGWTNGVILMLLNKYKDTLEP